MAKYTFCMVMLIIGISCENKNSVNLSPVAKNYIDEVIDLLQNNSINKNNINWEDFKKDVYRHAKDSKTIENTYPSISYAVAKLGDHHSYFVANMISEDSADLKPPPILQDEIVPQHIGYIRIGFCMGDEEQINNYITSVSEKIMKQDNADIKGWIVDLRENFGGNMWPMLVAIGPILGEGIVGYSIFPDSSLYSWNYKEGKIYDENGIWGQSTNPYHLKSNDFYVAVLTDSITASSGEAVAIAFKGRNKTKSFGTPTFGVSTGNRSHTLSDGSRINLTQCVFADRSKTKYGSAVFPDVICDEKETLSVAINWISSQQ